MAKSVDDRGRGARMARRDEGAYCRYVTEEQRSQPGWIGREGDRLSHSRALSGDGPEKVALEQVADRLDDVRRAIGELVQLGAPRAAGKYEHGRKSELHAAQDVRLHGVADDDRALRRSAELARG